MLEGIVQYCMDNGVYGLMLLAFTDSFISPIVPDIILVPLCLANPGMAIYYSAAATGASILGGLVGYAMGSRLGPVFVKRIVPEKHWLKIKNLVEKHSGWAIFWGAIAPMPYKFVSISAGVLGVNFRLFMIITVIGRSKRFLLEGILLYYFGPPLITMWEEYDEYGIWIIGAGVLLTLVGVYVYRRWVRRRESVKFGQASIQE